MSRKASAKWRLRAVALQQVVDAMFDHAPRRQAGQFVIIGGAEQMILERLLFGDIGGAREQQIALGDPNRPVRGEKHLFGLRRRQRLLPGRRRGRVRSNSRQVSRRSLSCEGAGAAAAISSSAAAASFTSRNSPCSSCTVTPAGSSRKTSRRMLNSESKSRFVAGLRRGRLKVVFVETVHGAELGKVSCSFG